MVTWMGYAVAVAGLMAIGALSLEKLCEQAGRPRRFAWLAGLSLALLVPLTASPPAHDGAAATAARTVAATPRPAPDPPAAPIGTASLDESGKPGDVPVTGTGATQRAALTLWGLASTAALLLVCAVLCAAALARRSWDRQRIAGEDVYVSRRFGPALVGVARPAIVIPRWVVRLGDAVGATVVRHEREHARAHDHLGLLYAGIVLALMPWNPAVWWMFLRLRTAVEIDCDRRVLASGVPAAEYGDLLLDIGSGRPARPFFALAMASSGTMLERRLKAMRNQGNNVRRSATALFGCAALAAIVIACGVPAPSGIAPAVNAALAEPVEGDEQATADAPGGVRQEGAEALHERAEAMRAAEQAREERIAEAMRAAEQRQVESRAEAMRAAEQRQVERAMQRLSAARRAFAERVSAATQDDLDRILQNLSQLLEDLKVRSEDARWMREAAEQLSRELDEYRSGAQRASAAARVVQEARGEYAEKVAEARERSAEARRKTDEARAKAVEVLARAAAQREEATVAREEAAAALERAGAAHRAATGEAARAAAAARQREAMLRVLSAASQEQEAAFREAYATWRETAAAALEKAIAELEKLVAEIRIGGARAGSRPGGP